MKRDNFDASVVEVHWAALQKSIGGIAPVRTERHYRKTVRLMNRLLDDAGQWLNQTDLREELGGPPVVSAILNGKRDINARQAKSLASRFKVPAGAFIR